MEVKAEELVEVLVEELVEVLVGALVEGLVQALVFHIDPCPWSNGGPGHCGGTSWEQPG